MSVQERYVDIVLTKEKFIDTVRAVVEGIVRHIPADEIQKEWIPELCDLMMDVYETEYTAYRQSMIETLGEVYTEEQLRIMVEFYTANPWAHEKVTENIRKTQENCHKIDERVIAQFDPLFEKFLEEKEGQGEEL